MSSTNRYHHDRTPPLFRLLRDAFARLNPDQQARLRRDEAIATVVKKTNGDFVLSWRHERCSDDSFRSLPCATFADVLLTKDVYDLVQYAADSHGAETNAIDMMSAMTERHEQELAEVKAAYNSALTTLAQKVKLLNARMDQLEQGPKPDGENAA
jgi:hypothetical protein